MIAASSYVLFFYLSKVYPNGYVAYSSRLFVVSARTNKRSSSSLPAPQACSVSSCGCGWSRRNRGSQNEQVSAPPPERVEAVNEVIAECDMDEEGLGSGSLPAPQTSVLMPGSMFLPEASRSAATTRTFPCRPGRARVVPGL